MTFKTEQEAFWAGGFGDEYSQRNVGPKLLASNTAFFGRALRNARQLGDCIEFGANVGLNLRALQQLYPGQKQYAVEINKSATQALTSILPAENIFPVSILDFTPERTFDLALIKGVLIHINPEFLPRAYEVIHRATGRYVLLCEYYNPSPVEVTYRGHGERLFKRDFCGEMLDAYPDLELVDYGFVYRRDRDFPQDDITWFLMQRNA